VTLALVMLPFLFPGTPRRTCEPMWCLVSDAMDLVVIVLPKLSWWTDSFSAHPALFLVLVVLLGCGLHAGSTLERRARDSIRPAWYRMLRPQMQPGLRVPKEPGRINRFVQRLRMGNAYQSACHFLFWQLVPTLFLLVVAYAGLAFMSEVAAFMVARGG
jgi:hypothetical protein